MLHSTKDLQSDEELAEQYKNSEESAAELISRYTKVIWIKAHAMSTVSVETDDLIQEGLLGLLSAIKTYNKNISSFSTYADRCITNKMLSAIKKGNTIPVSAEEDSSIKEKSDNDTPESILLEKENVLELDDKVSSHLSEKEMQIFRLILNGSTYNQVAHQLNIPVKTVDNALQRVRKKLKSVWRANK